MLSGVAYEFTRNQQKQCDTGNKMWMRNEIKIRNFGEQTLDEQHDTDAIILDAIWRDATKASTEINTIVSWIRDRWSVHSNCVLGNKRCPTELSLSLSTGEWQWWIELSACLLCWRCRCRRRCWAMPHNWRLLVSIAVARPNRTTAECWAPNVSLDVGYRHHGGARRRHPSRQCEMQEKNHNENSCTVHTSYFSSFWFPSFCLLCIQNYKQCMPHAIHQHRNNNKQKKKQFQQQQQLQKLATSDF